MHLAARSPGPQRGARGGGPGRAKTESMAGGERQILNPQPEVCQLQVTRTN